MSLYQETSVSRGYGHASALRSEATRTNNNARNHRHC